NLGLCKPVEYFQSSKRNDIYGVLPFVAPEVLRGQPYTLATHDFQLSLNICKGKRPKDIENVPQCYINLMKRCWDECQSKRPAAFEIKKIIESWHECDKNNNNGVKNIEEYTEVGEIFAM
ncbi:5709_t:CDS:2, partial [Funneliformis geosporum]